jgi:hypothetical protein
MCNQIACNECSLSNYNRDCNNNPIHDINVSWQEPWSANADESVAAGLDIKRAHIGAPTFDEALEIANTIMLTDNECNDMARNAAGVL